ncbi:winged helix-turn-helix domain-containing protein [Streptomyces sp. NPDC003781]|uniref:winged helix-turn-helix domain-containing protein n=1 Tax=Streptomyces sp. NPDC003781 TaxID=3364686 RepID=UPI0036817086
MTTVLSSSAPARPAPLPAAAEAADVRVGYLVYLPENADPAQLLHTHGLRAEIRPLGPRTPPAPAQTYGDDVVRIDRASRTVEVAGRELDLTYLEFGLLAHLVAHPHRVHTREALLSGIWGYDYPGDGRTVDVHVARVRRKLGAEHRGRIVTVRRVGYKYLPGHG